MNVVVGAKTDVGRMREGNEDSYFVEAPFYAVADGMGGHLAGDVASATAVHVIAKGSRDPSQRDGSLLESLVKEANAAIWEKAHSDARLRGMGTTCTLLLLHGETGHLAHVGDSRAYRLRNGELQQLTEDHTLVARMVREGRIAPEQAERHPQRNVITRALGADAEVEVDVESFELQDGDRLLLCSDGLSSMVDRAEIEEVLRAEPDAQRAADRLVEIANQAGGEDNITVVVLDVGDPPETAPVARASGIDEAATPSETSPPPPPPPVDVVEEQRAEAEPEGAPGRRSRSARLALWLFVLLLLAGLGYVAARYVLGNSYFVGVSEAGYVTIYQGVPGEFAGLSLNQAEERSDLRVDDLPEFKHDDLESGIEASSLQDATAKVAALEKLADDPEFQRDERPRPTPTEDTTR